MVTGLYRDLVKDAQELDNYERSTSLDDPDAIQTLIEEVGGYINNVSSKKKHCSSRGQFSRRIAKPTASLSR